MTKVLKTQMTWPGSLTLSQLWIVCCFFSKHLGHEAGDLDLSQLWVLPLHHTLQLLHLSTGFTSKGTGSGSSSPSPCLSLAPFPSLEIAAMLLQGQLASAHTSEHCPAKSCLDFVGSIACQDPREFLGTYPCRQAVVLGVGLHTPGLPVQVGSIELQNKVVPSDFLREIVVLPLAHISSVFMDTAWPKIMRYWYS